MIYFCKRQTRKRRFAYPLMPGKRFYAGLRPETAGSGDRGGKAMARLEDLTAGESVREFEVWASLPRYHGQEICLYRGRTMGHKAICAFPTMRTGRLRVKITSSDGPCRLRGFKAYYDE